jgi:uracil-DNA glycosylase family 4
MTERTGPLCHDHGIRGYGDPSHGVVVVGIGPGRDEAERTKRPFTGPSGRLLDDLLKFAQWPRHKVYATNAICWWNNSPTQAEIDACSPRFQRELTDAKPKLIVTCGAIANETVNGFKRRKGSRGSVTWSDRWNCYVLDTHHTSFALQSQSMTAVQDIIRDLSKIKEVVDWPADGAIADVSYNLVKSLNHAQQILNGLPKDRPIALDIETSSPDVEIIDAYTDQLLCFGISYLDNAGLERTFVFPQTLFPDCVRSGTHVRAHRQGGGCPACGLPRTVLNWPMDVRWTFQAGQYDIHGLHVYFDVLLPLRDDTMLMSACADERPGYHGLKQNAREWLGAGWYEERVKPFYKGKMNQLPPDELHQYNAKDAAYTRRLVTIHGNRMDEDGTRPLYEKLLLPAMNTFIAMQARGIAVDQAKLQELAYDNWFPRYVDMYRDLQLEAMEIGWPTDDLKLSSSPQMRKLFFTIIGADPVRYSAKTGQPSLDKETLDRLDHPFAAKVRAYRTLDTMIDYVLAVYNHLKYDGLLHPSAFVTTTRTGRTSYRDPAMQTIPKDYTVGADYAKLREIIVPHNPDTHEIIEADYNQIEVWLAWAESKDPTLLAHLQSGDVHSATAEGAFNIKRGDFSKLEWAEYRQRAKKIRFGLQYGEGAEKLSSPAPVGLGCSVPEARKFIDNFWRTYPVHRKWVYDIQRTIAEQGYIRVASGRVMRFPVVMDHKALRQAANFPIQANASDYCLDAMIELAPKLRRLDAHILLMIHDALVVESPRNKRAEVCSLIKEVMEKARYDGPSIRIDMKVGDNLGSVK